MKGDDWLDENSLSGGSGDDADIFGHGCRGGHGEIIVYKKKLKLDKHIFVLCFRWTR